MYTYFLLFANTYCTYTCTYFKRCACTARDASSSAIAIDPRELEFEFYRRRQLARSWFISLGEDIIASSLRSGLVCFLVQRTIELGRLLYCRSL